MGLSKKQEGLRKYETRFNSRIGGLITNQPISSWVPNSMTLRPFGYHARAVTFGCMAKGKGVSSRANLLISVKVLVGNTVSSGHHAKVVSSG
jgi:hypothetical protein